MVPVHLSCGFNLLFPVCLTLPLLSMPGKLSHTRYQFSTCVLKSSLGYTLSFQLPSIFSVQMPAISGHCLPPEQHFCKKNKQHFDSLNCGIAIYISCGWAVAPDLNIHCKVFLNSPTHTDSSHSNKLNQSHCASEHILESTIFSYFVHPLCVQVTNTFLY